MGRYHAYNIGAWVMLFITKVTSMIIIFKLLADIGGGIIVLMPLMYAIQVLVILYSIYKNDNFEFICIVLQYFNLCMLITFITNTLVDYLQSNTQIHSIIVLTILILEIILIFIVIIFHEFAKINEKLSAFILREHEQN